MSKKNVIVGQSGGPTSVINSSLYGVVTEAMKHPEEVGCVYGMVNGIKGFLEGKKIVLSDMSEEELKIMQSTPSSYLGSCRFKLPEDLSDPVFPQLMKELEELNVGYFFYIGGNDSMDTVSKMSRYAASVNSPIRFIGVPKTIDNDLICTDHCPGYGSAAKYVAATCREISLDAGVYGSKFVSIVEIMGRHAGWLTAASVLARKFEGDNPVLIYLPETVFSIDSFLADVEEAFKKTNNVMVAVSEGVHDAEGKFICEYATADIAVDNFGHKSLAGTAAYLADLVKQKFGCKVRPIEFSLLQRCAAHLSSLTDVTEAATAGSEGVKAALEGETGIMIGFKRAEGEEYHIDYVRVDVNEVCNQEKPFPAEWITNGGRDVGEGYVKYALPLIQGASPVQYENGLPVYAYMHD